MSEFEHTLHGRFLRGLALSGDRDAIRLAGRGITYAEAHRLALTWAGSLLRACDAPPRAIGVLRRARRNSRRCSTQINLESAI